MNRAKRQFKEGEDELLILESQGDDEAEKARALADVYPSSSSKKSLEISLSLNVSTVETPTS